MPDARFPSEQSLNQATRLISGDRSALFSDVTNPEQRIVVINMAIAAERNELLDELDSRLSHVSRWFELSRLYEP